MEIHFLPTGNTADAILIKFKDDKGIARNICIDGGYSRAYTVHLKKIFAAMMAANERIDLWIITHIHDDHIGGVVKFLKDPDFTPEFVDKYWFNPSYACIQNSSEIAVSKGIELRDYLIENNKCSKDVISTDSPQIDLFGGKFTILSPSEAKLNIALTAWEKEEHKKLGKPISGFDYHQPIQTLRQRKFKEDSSIWNGSSIAFLLELQGKKIFFLGDSHPSIVAQSIENKLGHSPENPLKLDLVKVSHHGSAKNTSPKLLSLIDCDSFVFCAYGNDYPAKETLIRIADARLLKSKPTRFLFNHSSPQLSTIFKQEPNASEALNFQFEHLPNGYLRL